MTHIDQHTHPFRMQKLVELTKKSFDTAHPSPFGASIYDLKTGELLGQSYSTGFGEYDPTNHAEVLAIRQVCEKTKRRSLNGCVLYSTCEPCAMCMSTSVWAELDMIVYGVSIFPEGNDFWRQRSDVTAQELSDRIVSGPDCAVVAGVELELCRELFKECSIACKEKETQLPS